LRLEQDAAISDEEESDKEDEGTLRRHRKQIQSDHANNAKVALLDQFLKQPLIPAFSRAAYSAEILHKIKPGNITAVTTLTKEAQKQKNKQLMKEQQDKNKEQKQNRKKLKRQEKRKAKLEELQKNFKNLPDQIEITQ